MTEPEPRRFLEIGRITKPHGLRGDLVVVLTTNRDDRLAVGGALRTDRGDLVVEASRVHQDRFVVSFRDVDSRERADELRGLVLSAEAIDDPDELWVHELIGCHLIESNGDSGGIDRGIIESVQENPASDLLVTDSGALVPVRFIISHRPGEEVIVDVPAGLFDD